MEPQTQVTFTGTRKELGWLYWRGFWLSIITLGIYRFWFKTKQRQYLWKSISFNNENMEYIGTGVELFKGFLFALIFIVPIYLGFFLAGLTSMRFIIISVLFLIATFLSGFAMFAARRYRLTRTLWRGLRFRMTGSGWDYAFRYFGWAVLQLITLGFSAPWGKAYLEKYKMQRTFYGDVQGDFNGKAIDLFKKMVILMLISALPIILVIYNLLSQISWGDWQDIITAVGTNDQNLINDVFKNLGVAKAKALSFYLSMIPLAFAVALLSFPAIQAIQFKWWANGVKLGGASLASNFTIKQSYKIWLKVLLLYIGGVVAISIIFMIIGAIFGGIYAAYGAELLPKMTAALGGLGFQIVIGILLFGFYMLFLFAILLLKALYITFPYWRDEINSLTVYNLEALDGVEARYQHTNALGEGLDAADVGGFGGF